MNSRSVSEAAAGPSYIAVIGAPKPPNGHCVSRILDKSAPIEHSWKSGPAIDRKSTGVTAYRPVVPGQTCRSAISPDGQQPPFERIFQFTQKRTLVYAVINE